MECRHRQSQSAAFRQDAGNFSVQQLSTIDCKLNHFRFKSSQAI